MTLLVVVLTGAGVNLGASLSQGPSALIDAAIFAGIAFGLLKKSRAAALDGLIAYLIEWFSAVEEGANGLINLILPVLLTTAFVNGVRGCFSWQRRT